MFLKGVVCVNAFTLPYNHLCFSRFIVFSIFLHIVLTIDILQERDRRLIYAVRIAVDRCFLRSGWSEFFYAVKDGSRQSEQWGERMSGVNKRHGARIARWRVRSGAERIRRFLDIVYMVNPSFILYCKCGIMLTVVGT